MRRLIAVTLGALLAGPLASAVGAEVLELELQLIRALGDGGSLTMDLTRTGDRWERVWAGDTESRKIHLFTGRVAKAGLFLSYPLDTRPQHPSEAMPLTWQAPDFGYHGFRNSWKGQGDFILQVYAKAHVVGGWNGPNAGTFRLFGLGQSWNDDYSGREICAWQTNRVMTPDPSRDGYGAARERFPPRAGRSVTVAARSTPAAA
jgi:hypothetical protein